MSYRNMLQYNRQRALTKLYEQRLSEQDDPVGRETLDALLVNEKMDRHICNILLSMMELLPEEHPLLHSSSFTWLKNNVLNA